MAHYSYEVAARVLGESELKRVLACFLSLNDPCSPVDWEVATKSYGSASVESMKVSTRNLLRKITKATEAGAGGFEDAGKPDTPVKTPKKRKADASPDNDGSAKAKKSRAKKVKAEPIEEIITVKHSPSVADIGDAVGAADAAENDNMAEVNDAADNAVEEMQE